MRIWVARHGQTNMNKEMLMQGRTDAPLNETGIAQAKAMRQKVGDVHFDAVYSSPLQRAVLTASILADVPRDQVITDPRIIEVDYGKYERRRYYRLGPAMTCFWLLPEILPAPKTVETIASMKQRTQSFLREIEGKDYENVLVTCHGGIMRVLCGYLDDRRNGLMWRPKPHNCEVRVFEALDGHHHMVQRYLL